MDTTTRFFSKLRKLAVTLESETAKLQHSFENRNNDDDSEATAKAMRAYHELNCEVGTLKGQIQGQLAQQRAQENEVSNLIKACRVMEQRVTKDVQTLRDHWEKYGYKAPKDSQRPADDKSQESEAEDQLADDNDDNKSAEEEEEEEEGDQEEAGDAQSSSPIKIGPLPVIDVLRTPQLSDFGLSEIQIKRAVAGAKWSEAPPMPEISLPHPSLNTPAPPPMPITPKCALRMDDDELLTPQMNDFGISEDTMFLNNDFTMDLFRKNPQKPQRASEDKPAAPVDSLKESLQTKALSAENLESPEPPVFCTPGFKIKKTNGHCAPAAQAGDDPESPDRPGNLAATPEVPAFQTPYLNRLVSTKKSAQPPEPIAMQADDDSHTFHLPTPPRNGAASSKRSWEYNVPEISVLGVEDKHMPEMPNLESDLGNSLRSRSAKIPKKTSEREEVTKELTVNSLNLDSPTQDFSLGTACIRMDYQEPSTPEMPDLSSVTQEICKTQLKKLEAAIVHQKVRPEKHRNSSVSLPVVSESEFQSLPSYLRQMNLHNLNQVVHNINKFSAEFQGEKTEFQIEELKRISNVGAKTPIYLLCLTELKRLEHVGGARNTSVYKLIRHT